MAPHCELGKRLPPLQIAVVGDFLTGKSSLLTSICQVPFSTGGFSSDRPIKFSIEQPNTVDLTIDELLGFSPFEKMEQKSGYRNLSMMKI